MTDSVDKDFQRSPEDAVDDAAAEQPHAPVHDDSATVQPDLDAPGLSVLDQQPGDPVEPNEPA